MPPTNENTEYRWMLDLRPEQCMTQCDTGIPVNAEPRNPTYMNALLNLRSVVTRSPTSNCVEKKCFEYIARKIKPATSMKAISLT